MRVKQKRLARGMTMEQADLQRYQSRLLEKQRELMFEEANPESLVPRGGGREGDLGDQAKADAEAELQLRLHQSEGRLLRAIDGALARIRKGTYGVCEVCKQPISKARLEAVPWTRLCRDCKESKPSAA